MSNRVKISVGQFDALEDKGHNLTAIAKLAKEAASAGARILVLPEGAMYHGQTASPAERVRNAEPGDGAFVRFICDLSLEFGLFIAVGMSQVGRGADEGVRANNVLLLVDAGEVVHRYEKIHLYDAFSARESETAVPGNELPPVLEIDGVKVGFAICYDLRFPELFRLLVDQGAEVLVVSAAWVRGVLKEEHWLTLLRARAIENTCYVFAAGESSNVSIGRSVIFDPLGAQLGDAGESRCATISAVVRAERLAEVRSALPSLGHRRIDVEHRIKPLAVL